MNIHSDSVTLLRVIFCQLCEVLLQEALPLQHMTLGTRSE